MNFLQENTRLLYSLLTIITLLAVLIIRKILISLIQKSNKLNRQSKRILRFNITTISIVFLTIVTIFLWSHELKSFAFSIVAFSVAIVLATKELLLCISSAVYKSFVHIAKMGDRIEINGIRGDVISTGLLSTTVLEIGPGTKSHQYTGRSIIIPNSYFLQHRTINESFLKDYVLHIFTIPISIYSNIEKAKEELELIANATCTPYLEDAKKHINHLQESRNVETPDPTPRILLNFIDAKTVKLNVRISVPSNSKGEIEKKIIESFLKTRKNWLEN